MENTHPRPHRWIRRRRVGGYRRSFRRWVGLESLARIRELRQAIVSGRYDMNSMLGAVVRVLARELRGG